jgi:hypothetical protein
LNILKHAKQKLKTKEIQKMNENQAQQNQAANQATNQASQKNQAAAKYAEAKTVVNGQEVKVKEAQAAEEAFNKQNTQTGIQQHHDNSTEAVQAGEMAQNASTQNMQQQQSNAGVKQVDLQSGQQHLSQHLQQAQQETQQLEQTMQQEQQQKMQQAQQQNQQQSQAMKQAQQSQTISQDEKSHIEDHETIQKSIDAKAKARAKKAD